MSKQPKQLTEEEKAEIHRLKEGHLPHYTPPKTMLGSIVDWVSWGLQVTGLHKFTLGKEDIYALVEDVATDIPCLGDQTGTMRRFKKFFEEIDEDFIPPQGRIAFRKVLFAFANNRSQLFKYVREHPEIQDIELKTPVFIQGMPRTGSTILQKLLANDRRARSLRLWETGFCCSGLPPATSPEQSRTDPRIQESKEGQNGFNKLYQGFWDNIAGSHYMTPEEYDEETMVMYDCGLLHVHVPLATLGNSFFEDLFDGDASDVYRFLKLYYKAIQSGYAPESHWICKSPFHSLYLPTLKESFPDAKLVFTHRDPVASIASYAALLEVFICLYFPDGAYDRRASGQFSYHFIKCCCDRIMEYQKTADPSTYVNVYYEDVVKDPISVAKRIYTQFGFPFDEQTVADIEEARKNNPQGKHGRTKYSLEMYGLTPEQVHKDFKEYIEMFIPKDKQ